MEYATWYRLKKKLDKSNELKSFSIKIKKKRENPRSDQTPQTPEIKGCINHMCVWYFKLKTYTTLLWGYVKHFVLLNMIYIIEEPNFWIRFNF
jgi:hypothetical protein